MLDTVPYSAGGAWAVNLWMKPGSTYGSDFQYLFSHAEDKYYATGWESNQASPLVSAVLHLWLSGVCTHLTHTASCPSPNSPKAMALGRKLWSVLTTPACCGSQEPLVLVLGTGYVSTGKSPKAHGGICTHICPFSPEASIGNDSGITSIGSAQELIVEHWNADPPLLSGA